MSGGGIILSDKRGGLWGWQRTGCSLCGKKEAFFLKRDVKENRLGEGGTSRFFFPATKEPGILKQLPFADKRKKR